MRVRPKLSSADVIDVLTDVFIVRGIPGYIRSDNGPDFVADTVRQWAPAARTRTAFVEPGSSWENGYIESFNARLRDQLLNAEIFYTLKKAQVLTIDSWRCHYNAVHPHSSLGYRPPTPETIVMPRWPPGSAPLNGHFGQEAVNAPTFTLNQSPGADRPAHPLPTATTSRGGSRRHTTICRRWL